VDVVQGGSTVDAERAPVHGLAVFDKFGGSLAFLGGYCGHLSL